MCSNVDVVEYPEEGFAILQDTRGSYLVFRDSDKYVDLRDDLEPAYKSEERPRRLKRDETQYEEFEFA